MGSGQKICTRVLSSQFFDAWVGMGHQPPMNLENTTPKKPSNFSIFFPLDKKNLIGSGQKTPGLRVGWPLI